MSRYPTVMFSTGPMFLTYEASSYLNRSGLDTLSPELYGKYSKNSSYALFRHLKGKFKPFNEPYIENFSYFLASSWHGRDALMIKSIYRWRYIIFLVFIINVLMSLLLIDIFQQCRGTMKYSYKNYLPIPLHLNNSKEKEQSDVNRKFIQILLVNFIIFCCALFILNKVINSSLFDHDNKST